MEDLVFRAHCQIDNLQREIDEGGRILGHDDGEIEVELHDGSYTTIYLGPIKELVARLEQLPALFAEA